MSAPPRVVAPHWTVLSVHGPESATWLNGIVTCDVTSVAPGRGAFGLLLSKTGKVQAELSIVGQSDALWLGVSGGDAAEVERTLGHYLVMEDAELESAPDRRFVAFYGSSALEFAQNLAPGASAVASAVGWAGDHGAALVVEASRVAEIVERALAAGASLGLTDADRVTLGLPAFGVDYSTRDNPHEASLERRAVSWSKGCYLGQEVVCMQDMRGKVKRRLVRLSLPSIDAGGLRAGASVSADGVRVGELTTVGEGQAIAMVAAPFYEPGRQVQVGDQLATVAPLLES